MLLQFSSMQNLKSQENVKKQTTSENFYGLLVLLPNSHQAINHKGNWLGTFLDKVGWTKKNLLERDLNLRPPDWCAGALPTELSSPTLAVFLFCQYLCSGAPVRSHKTIYCPFSQGSHPSYDTTLEEAVGDAPWRDMTFFYKYHAINHKGNWLGKFLDKFGWTKKNWLERDLNLRPPDWRVRALPTELSSPTLAVSLFCQYLCSGAPVRSHETIYCPFNQGLHPSYDTTLEEAVGDAPWRDTTCFINITQ